MTSEEALQIILNERGYLVVSSRNIYKPGQVKAGINLNHKPIAQPVVVIAITDAADMQVQRTMLEVLLGLCPNPWKPNPTKHYYRVVTD